MSGAMTKWRFGGALAILTTTACGRPADVPAASPASPQAPVASAAPAPASHAHRVSFGDLGKAPPPPAPGGGLVYNRQSDLANSPGSPLLDPAAEAVRQSDWPLAKQHLAAALVKLDRTASFSPWLVAHALWGRACATSGNEPCAEKEYGAVRDAWADPDAAARQARGDGDERTQTLSLERALLSVEEAYFFFAEKKRKETVDPLTMPRYKGTGTREDVLAFNAKFVGPWVAQRQLAIRQAEKEYNKIPTIQPKPSARWMIEAASADGQMWAQFAAEMLDAPMPDAWKQEGRMPDGSMTWAEMRAFYAKVLDTASEPVKARARAAFEDCKRVAEISGAQNAATKVCTEWLQKHPAPTGAAP